MGKRKAISILLLVFFVCHPFSAAASNLQENPANAAPVQKASSEVQAPDAVQIILVKPFPDFPRQFATAKFKQELQRRLRLQFIFSAATQLLAWFLGLLALVVISVRQRGSALGHTK